jgi:hypothetical protein
LDEVVQVSAKLVIKNPEGTFAVPTYFIPVGSPAYEAAQKMFRRIKWKKPLKRADAINNRFNAFSSLLWAVTADEDWTTCSLLKERFYPLCLACLACFKRMKSKQQLIKQTFGTHRNTPKHVQS